jgi:hypothetical protein
MSLFIAMIAGATTAWADVPQTGGADPSTKTLPAKASDTAQANAFGQQGARSRAAHQAARATAAKEAHAAVDRPQQPAASTTRPNASAQSHASATGVSNGFDHASLGAANGQGSTTGRGSSHRH